MDTNVLPEEGFSFPTGHYFFITEHLALALSLAKSPHLEVLLVFKPLLCPGVRDNLVQRKEHWAKSPLILGSDSASQL